jgi:uncharacterized repeat protein (TIGR01451 family)
MLKQKNINRCRRGKNVIVNAQFTINKTPKGNYLDIGDVITYTIKGVNNSRNDIYNLYIEDSLNPSIQFIPGTVTINDTLVSQADVLSGILTPKLSAGQSIVISYEVVITNTSYINYTNILDSVKYEYSLTQSENALQNLEINNKENCTKDVPMYNFRQISIEKKLSFDLVKPDMKEISGITSEIEIIKDYIIATPNIKSLENQNLSGYKLIVHGLIKYTVQYIAIDELVYSSHYNIPFSTFIVMAENYEIGSKLYVEGIVEDIYYKKMNSREYLTNAIVLVNAKILCG